MHTLTVTGSTLSGKPDNGDDVVVFDAGNPAAFGDGYENFNVFYHGVAKYSVPAGRYWAFGDFLNFSSNGLSERLVILPQFTVGPHTVVRIPERAATSEIAAVTPRPAVTQQISFQLVRSSRNQIDAFSWAEGPGVPLWISPTTRKPTADTLNAWTSALLTSPPGPGTPYAYNLNFAGPDGLIPAQHYVVRPARLASVDERYYQDGSITGYWFTLGGFSLQLQTTAFGLFLPLRLPGRQVQYLSVAPGEAWTGGYVDSIASENGPWGGQSQDALQYLAPGSRQTVEWNRFPLHPQPEATGGGMVSPLSGLIPSAVRSGSTLTLSSTPYSDNEPGHLGAGFSPGPGVSVTGSYEIDQNGVRIARGDPANGIPEVQLSAKPSLISFTLDAARTGRVSLSQASSTVWTWRSARQRGVVLPPAWLCGYTPQGDPISSCVVQPMMTLGYRVRGLALTGSVRPGPQQIALSVGHLQLATAPRVTGARAQVSYNDGQSWKPASVASSGGGNFRIAFSAPGGVDVTLRVSATDAAGGSITETILRAYRTLAAAPAASAGPALRPACPSVPAGHERCFVLYQRQTGVNLAIAEGIGGRAVVPRGWSPRALAHAYRLPVQRNSHQTVAVSIAFNTPRLAQYLAVYRKYFGLPRCTVASGCFRQVNQRGKAGPLPLSGAGSGWDLEATLDVSMISVACPHCRILVVEADDDSDPNLAATENTAARLGAQVISNSYGGRENGFALAGAGAYRHPGHTIVVSAGDLGYTAANFPADLSSVTAVGGTQLARAHNKRGWSERVWNNSVGAGGSGCSAYVRKPAWQHDRHCPMRTVADVSAVAADVPIYNKYWGGWVTVAGTSVSAPLIAGIYGLAGNAAKIRPGYLYQHATALFDITTGNNGFLVPAGSACGGDYLCVAKKGYDAPTGLGTPDGIGGF